MKHQKGILFPLERLPWESLEEQIRRLLGDEALWQCENTVENNLNEQIYSNGLETKYQLLYDTLYEIKDFEDVDPEAGYASLIRNKNGSFSFEFKYDSVETCLAELLKESFKEI